MRGGKRNPRPLHGAAGHETSIKYTLLHQTINLRLLTDERTILCHTLSTCVNSISPLDYSQRDVEICCSAHMIRESMTALTLTSTMNDGLESLV